MKECIDAYKELPINVKRDKLLNEVADLLNAIEFICLKKNIKIEKLKSSYYIKNKDKLFEEDYFDLLYIYILYLKEDLASIL